jgi:cell division protein FtsW
MTEQSLAMSIYSRIDKPLLVAFLAALSIGLIMVASASVNFAHEQRADQLYFLKRHLVYLTLGISIAIIAIRVPLNAWYLLSPYLLMGAIALLALVLIPGIGLRVNGSQRWLNAGPLTLQVSELAKIGLILFLAGYLVRRGDDLRSQWHGFAVPAGLLMLMVMLLILEPDFGSVVVITGVTCALLFLAGIPLGVFLALAASGIAALSFFALSSPYRMQRITAFVDPWADQFNSGYQLTQSLIAFGRGEWFGVGLGNSLQKLFYLPEAHTDFVFAIIAEELGLVGALAVLGLLFFIVARIIRLGVLACRKGEVFGGYVAIGVGVLFGLQAAINMGVSSGLFPTKGLTLPFISYGGSSLLVCLFFAAICLRISMELQEKTTGTRRADRD